MPAHEVAEESAEDKAPALDVTLEETKRILMDLVSLSGKGKPFLVVTKPAERN